MADVEEIAVGELKVIAYVPIQCPQHVWKLTVLPVTECAYYRCVKNDDAQAYHDYMDLWAKRNAEMKHKYPYSEYFLKLVKEIREARGYDPAKSAKQPIKIFKGTRWLEEGHHRAAIICALFGPEANVSVEVSSSNLPNDLDLCSNPCPTKGD